MNDTNTKIAVTVLGIAGAITTGAMIIFAVLTWATMNNKPAGGEAASIEHSLEDLRNKDAGHSVILATVNAAPKREIVLVNAVDLPYDEAVIIAGQATFATVCSACHGMDANGVANLGKTLRDSEFMRGLPDRDLLTFVKTGRPIWDAENTTGIDMPPKGGNPTLTDEDILNIIAYLRTLDPKYVPFPEDIAAAEAQPTEVTENNAESSTASEPTSAAPVVEETPSAETTPESAASSSGDGGEALFVSACSACHGADARGLPNLGKDLVASEFVQSKTDDELLTFVKTGRPLWDAENTTGIDMPPKGGNPALTNEDILTIIGYIRSLNSGVATESATNETTTVGGGSAGETAFLSYCSACHGLDARGLPNLGKDLVTSEFVQSKADDELLTFVKTGRPIWDAENTTGIDMPPKGGNPAITDEEILSIIQFIRSLAE